MPITRKSNSMKGKKGKSNKTGNSKTKCVSKHRRSLSKNSNNKNNKHNKSNNSSSYPNKKLRLRHVEYLMRGGSDWISSQYSLGSANAPEQSANYVNQFSHSAAGSRDTYMNPQNLGLAGSGGAMGDLEGAGVRTNGSPL